MADELFNQADLNRDERLDFNEFRNLLTRSLVGNTQERSPYRTVSSALYGDIDGAYEATPHSAETLDDGLGTHGREISYSPYDQPSYTSGADDTASANFGPDVADANEEFGSNVNYESTNASSFLPLEASSSQQLTQVDPRNPQNLYEDPNPQIIRRAAQSGPLTYTQNIKVRFLQPPPVPPPGPLIIKEVRPPQPPPPPPLRIRQQAPELPPLPPLVLRERPPLPPAPVASQTVVRRLPAVPVPPRSIIIERLPPLPPKPRDIVIERWLPYAAQAKRRTIVQRAGAAHVYPKPRNIIIQYEPVQVRVIRKFQRYGVTAENPTTYVQRYGASLLDSQTLVQQARAAGVVEDISPPTNATSKLASSNADLTGDTVNLSASPQINGGQNGNATLSGYESVQGGDPYGGVSSALYQSNSFSSQGSGSTLTGMEFGGPSASPADFNRRTLDAATAAFNAADQNKDGALDANEFRRFVSSHLPYAT